MREVAASEADRLATERRHLRKSEKRSHERGAMSPLQQRLKQRTLRAAKYTETALDRHETACPSSFVVLAAVESSPTARSEPQLPWPTANRIGSEARSA
jgi:hypothetical protein